LFSAARSNPRLQPNRRGLVSAAGGLCDGAGGVFRPGMVRAVDLGAHGERGPSQRRRLDGAGGLGEQADVVGSETMSQRITPS
jgi:hypothetical protein